MRKKHRHYGLVQAARNQNKILPIDIFDILNAEPSIPLDFEAEKSKRLLLLLNKVLANGIKTIDQPSLFRKNFYGVFFP